MLENAVSISRDAFSGRVDNGENVDVIREVVNGGKDEDEEDDEDM